MEWNGGANLVQKSRAINNKKCRNGDVSACNVKTLGDLIKDNKQYILIGTSLLPIVGDIQGFVEAETTGDYVFATIGLVPGLGDAAQKAHTAKKAYDAAKSANDVNGMKAAIQQGVDALKAQGKAQQLTGKQAVKKAESGEITTLLLPTPKTANERRNSAGKVFSSTKLTELKAGESLFKGGNSAPVPKQVADKLSGRGFNNFGEFRSAFWKEMASDPAVAQNFDRSNLALMRQGKAPIAPKSQHNGDNKRYELDHNIEIRDGGTIYNLDNIIIRTPKDHKEKTSKRGR
ncbi:HNH/ENDO VII family nuclease [Moraxella cuniculi]|uniref:HNH/ENDO VII family nuclease n=1 Tax=Moraxella cuniculi TaxID=34061 RepID=UPI00223C2978|nr:HNH/ENDO VII family nuclease [Moraxella cuniculi]